MTRIGRVTAHRITTKGVGMSGALTRTTGQMVSLAPQSFQEALAFAEKVAQTDMVPESDRNKPGNILAKIQFGAEIGLPPFQSIQKLFCTKGRVGMEVSAMQAVVEASGLCEDIDVTWDEASQTATATTTRKGRKPVTLAFSAEDALPTTLIAASNSSAFTDPTMLVRTCTASACTDVLTRSGVAASAVLEVVSSAMVHFPSGRIPRA